MEKETNMKNTIREAELTVICFGSEDIITTSSLGPGTQDDGEITDD